MTLLRSLNQLQLYSSKLVHTNLFRTTTKYSLIRNTGNYQRNQSLQNALRRFTTNDASNTGSIRNQKIIGYWLAGCAGLTFATVCIGGITRLTESGLSMVDWHPFKEVPPSSKEAWESEFEKYKQYPEWKVKNQEITLEQFKWIWFMEYAHRTLGRTIGAVYFLPMAFFWYKKWFNKPMKIRTLIFGSILGFQGFLGWYMVKSGLEEKTVYNHEPRVSQYRLAAHLGTAMVFYSLIFWNALTNLLPNPQATQLPKITSSLVKFKRLTMMSKLLVFTTAISGAFVAGLDAGLVYNTWPKMADRWIPSDMFRHNPLWKNFFENATTVQFDHRHLAEATSLFILAVWAYSLKLKLPPRARMASNLLAACVLAQATLGICTLLYHVPVELASAHQAGALTTLSVALWLSQELKWIKRIPK
ncbi:Cytochrome c oxidase assembly protein cox15 [Blomia tropicalis]|nr:Cytochrome c oxidase assembly protein cox15 [Blomia tropicalis]